MRVFGWLWGRAGDAVNSGAQAYPVVYGQGLSWELAADVDTLGT